MAFQSHAKKQMDAEVDVQACSTSRGTHRRAVQAPVHTGMQAQKRGRIPRLSRTWCTANEALMPAPLTSLPCS
jgi:hypothetical protein